jgi:hypothetical protein
MKNLAEHLLYAKDGGFLIESPIRWIIDLEVGKNLGTCCVFYPKDSAWDNGQTVMYPTSRRNLPDNRPSMSSWNLIWQNAANTTTR